MALRPIFGPCLHRFWGFETLKSFMGPHDQPPNRGGGGSLYLFSGTSLRTCPALPAAGPPTCVSCWLLHPSSLCRIIMPSSYRLKLYDLCSFRYVVQEIKNDLIFCIGYDAGGGVGIELTILYARKRASHIVGVYYYRCQGDA